MDALELSFKSLDKAFEAYTVQLKVVEGNLRRLHQLADRCIDLYKEEFKEDQDV